MRVDGFDEIMKKCRALSAGKDVYFILRIQSRKDLSIHINNGRTEEISTANLEGIGLQLINSQGFMGFAASDQVDVAILEDLFAKALFLAEQSQSVAGESNREIFKLKPLHKRVEIPLRYPYSSLSLNDIEAKLMDLNREVGAGDSRLAVRTILRLTDEEWRIGRSDGTDVAFNTPRSFVFHSITAKNGAETATTYANLPGTDLEVIIEPEKLERLKKRAKKAVTLAINLLSAGKIPGGHYKMVIDYALAKGLAHEAFGHAAETDNLESSILGKEGRFRTGMIVANPRLSIIDGPVEGDYAYQPISAVGIERRTVTIVDHGRLQNGLADIFSAAGAGVPPTGAERVESVFQLPIARMTNIRIMMDNPLPLKKEFETVTPEDLYRILRENELIQPGETVLYLSGFHGGQVNPAFGDFVFHCSGIYTLGPEPVLYKPAIFSGKILSVLRSVSAAIGEPRIDAMGTCGKMGQAVPSCGGAHEFLLIESNPEVMIGGE